MESTEKGTISGESWREAHKYVARLGEIPTLFTAAIRLLIEDHQSHGGVLRPVTKFVVGRTVRGPRFTSMLFHSTKHLKPYALEGATTIRTGDLLGAFRPLDLAMLIGIFILYRRCRRIHERDLTWFNQSMPRFRSASQIGGLIGIAIPEIGPGIGSLAASVHHLALPLIGSYRADAVDSYAASIGGRGLLVDPELERSLFGCTSVEVGTLMLSALGLPRSMSEGYWRGAEMSSGAVGLDGTKEKFHFARVWADSLLLGEDHPAGSLPGSFYPLASERRWLDEQVMFVRGDRKSWFESEASDISPERTPQLFASDAERAEVPNQLQDIFTYTEVVSMEERDFDDLVDALDEQIENGQLDTIDAE